MANIDWSSITTLHKSGNLKEHFASTFTNVKAKEAYMQYCKYFLSEFHPSSTLLPDISMSVSILRLFVTSLPAYILSDLPIDSKLLDWFGGILADPSQKLPVKGAVLSTLALITRNIPALLQTSFDKIGNCFSATLGDISTLTAGTDMSTEIYLGVTIVIHQLEDLLNVLGCNSNNQQKSHTMSSAAVSATLKSIASILKNVSTLDTSTSTTIGRMHVDCVKLCGMLCEMWMTANQNDTSLIHDTNEAHQLSTMPHSLFHIVTTGDVTHDCFHGAYHGAVQVLQILKMKLVDDTDETVCLCLAAAMKECTEYLRDGSLLEVVDCARMEIVVGFLSCFFDGSSNTDNRVTNDIVDSAVNSISILQSRMRETAQSFADSKDIPKETQKELKSMYSDIRKGSIATATSVLIAGSDWVADHQTAYWDLCLKALATPVLFVAGYKAVSNDVAFTTRMLAFLDTALRSVSRYSAAAAEDIILALQDLSDNCSDICPQLFHSDNSEKYDIPRALLAAYALTPKSTPSSGGRGVTETQLNWRVAVVVTVNSLVQQCTKLRVENKHAELSSLFVSELVELFACEIISLSAVDGGVGLKTKQNHHSADLRAELLQSLVVGLIATTDLLKTYDSKDSNHSADFTAINLSLRRIAVHVMSRLHRDLVFEDDRVLLCTEIDLLTRIAIRLTSCPSSATVTSMPLLTVPVMALCNMLLTRNGCDACLTLDLTCCMTQYVTECGSTGDIDNEVSLAIYVAERVEELRCMHTSSMSADVHSQHQKQPHQTRLHFECDVVYEATREALLSMAHHCALHQSHKEKEEQCLQRIYDSLPLEVNEQPTLDVSGIQPGVTKIEVNSSFMLDILTNMRQLNEV